jgi:ribonucleoside-diphosphate reductase alpha chain
LEVLVNKFSHTRFEPNGHTTNPEIRIAKSVVDYIFRWMGLTFLAGYREEQKAKAELISGNEPKEASKQTLPVVSASAPSRPVVETASETPRTESIRTESIRTEARFVSHEDKSPGWAITSTAVREDSRAEQFTRFQSDAPACDNCGSVTVRNGNCYLCHNCGNSLGCS